MNDAKRFIAHKLDLLVAHDTTRLEANEVEVILAADVEWVEQALHTMTAERDVLHDKVLELKAALGAGEQGK